MGALTLGWLTFPLVIHITSDQLQKQHAASKHLRHFTTRWVNSQLVGSFYAHLSNHFSTGWVISRILIESFCNLLNHSTTARIISPLFELFHSYWLNHLYFCYVCSQYVSWFHYRGIFGVNGRPQIATSSSSFVKLLVGDVMDLFCIVTWSPIKAAKSISSDKLYCKLCFHVSYDVMVSCFVSDRFLRARVVIF